jgi:hypothetical protein
MDELSERLCVNMGETGNKERTGDILDRSKRGFGPFLYLFLCAPREGNYLQGTGRPGGGLRPYAECDRMMELQPPSFNSEIY